MNSWTTRTVLYSRPSKDGVVVEVTWLPALPGLEIGMVVDWHERELRERDADVRIGDLEIQAEGLQRRIDLTTSGGAGIARYLEARDRMYRITATADAGTPEEVLVSALGSRIDEELMVPLTTLEARLVEQLLGVESVHFIGAPWWHELDPTARDLVGEQLSAGLLDQELLVVDGETVRVSERLRRAVLPVLDARLIVVASRRGAASDRSLAIGNRDDEWSILTEDGPSRLRFLPLTGDGMAARLLDELAVPPGETGHPATTAVSGAETLWHVSLIRAAGSGLEAREVAWFSDPLGRLWRMSGSAEADELTISATDAARLRIELGEALGAATPTLEGN
jgi:hypothetical protein